MINKFQDNSGYNRRTRVNFHIKFSPVVVIDEDGEKLGTIATEEAIRIAKSKNMDLVEIVPDKRPPICKIMDYGKFKYEKSIKDKQQKKHTKTTQTKQVRLTPNIGIHDLDVKANSVRGFLEDGNRVQLKVIFDKREIVFSEKGREVIKNLFQKVEDVGKMVGTPNLLGKFLFADIEPKSK